MLVSDLRYNDFASRIQALRSSTAKTLFEHHRASAIAMLDQSIALARQRYGDHSDLESTQETSAAPNWTVVKKSADAVGTEECICGIKANGHYLPVLKVANSTALKTTLVVPSSKLISHLTKWKNILDILELGTPAGDAFHNCVIRVSEPTQQAQCDLSDKWYEYSAEQDQWVRKPNHDALKAAWTLRQDPNTIGHSDADVVFAEDTVLAEDNEPFDAELAIEAVNYAREELFNTALTKRVLQAAEAQRLADQAASAEAQAKRLEQEAIRAKRAAESAEALRIAQEAEARLTLIAEEQAKAAEALREQEEAEALQLEEAARAAEAKKAQEAEEARLQRRAKLLAATRKALEIEAAIRAKDAIETAAKLKAAELARQKHAEEDALQALSWDNAEEARPLDSDPASVEESPEPFADTDGMATGQASQQPAATAKPARKGDNSDIPLHLQEADALSALWDSDTFH